MAAADHTTAERQRERMTVENHASNGSRRTNMTAAAVYMPDMTFASDIENPHCPLAEA